LLGGPEKAGVGGSIPLWPPHFQQLTSPSSNDYVPKHSKSAAESVNSHAFGAYAAIIPPTTICCWRKILFCCVSVRRIVSTYPLM
jgi:hypothetical protein